MFKDNLDTPLHVACNNGDEEMVTLLLFYGAEIDAEDKDGMTPLLRYLSAPSMTEGEKIDCF